MNKKQKGYLYEELVKEYLIDHGWTFLEGNFTMRGGEIDLVFLSPENVYVFVEVRSVDFLDDVTDYITHNKLKNLVKSIEYYLLKHHIYDQEWRLDVVLVKNSKILEHIQNILVD